MMRALSVIAFAASLLAAPTLAQLDSTKSDGELRKSRKWALSAELGMNSLSSVIGPVATFYVKPQIAVDLGLGLNSMGLRPGFRARYSFTSERTAYFAGVGLKHGLGTGGQEFEIEDPKTKGVINFQINPGTFLDFMVGVESIADNVVFIADKGHLLIVTAGYSILLGDKAYSISEGFTPSEDAIKAFDKVFGSGIMLSVSLGKAF